MTDFKVCHCGKLLGELGAAYLGLNASAFSSYGSEKRGSAVKAYVRFSAPEREILHNSPIEHPSILALFHLALSKTMPVTAGVSKNCIVVVNTAETPESTRDILKLSAGKIFCVDALGIAMRTHSRVNMIMLGAIIKASGFIPLEAAKELDPMELIYQNELPLFDKYDEFLPPELVKKGFACSVLDIQGVKKRINEW